MREAGLELGWSLPSFYSGTVLRDVRSRDHGDYDVLEAVLPPARKRGTKTI